MTFTQEEIEEAQRIGKQRQAARRNKKLGQLGRWLSGAFIIVLLDQLSKWAIMEHVLRPNMRGAHESLNFLEWYTTNPVLLPYTEIKITSFFNIVMVWNTGVSFGMFGNMGNMGHLLLILLATGITFLFTMWLIDAKTQFQRLCYILVIGGALGNIIDRLRFGAVMDFLDVHVAGYHWPAFNVADSAVVIGITMLIGGLMVVDNKRKASSKKRLKERQKNRAKYLRSY